MRLFRSRRAPWRAPGLAVALALMICAVGAGTANASVDVFITSPGDGQSINWEPGLRTTGECRQTGPGAVIQDCTVNIVYNGSILSSHDIGPQSDPNIRQWAIDLPCMTGSFRTVAGVVGTGGGSEAKQVDYSVTCDPHAQDPPPAPTFPPSLPEGTVFQVGGGTGFTPTCPDGDVHVQSCTTTVTKPDGSTITLGPGDPLPSDQPGIYTVTVTSVATNGKTTTSTRTYRVNAPPFIVIASPIHGGEWYVDEAIASSYFCGDTDGFTVFCNGPVGSTQNIDTSSTGHKSFTVNTQDNDGAAKSLTHEYDVYKYPTVEITGPAGDYPAAGAVVTPTQDGPIVFHGGCDGGIPPVTCTRTATAPDGSVSDIADGANAPESQYGMWTLKVVVKDKRGTTVETTRKYKVNHPPTASVTTPIEGKKYFVDQPVTADYSCADEDGNVETCQGPVDDGQPIDTATVGHKTFTVNAVDNDGGKGEKVVHYTVHPVVGPCRGSALRALGALRFGIANEPINPCKPAAKTDIIAGGPGSLLGLVVPNSASLAVTGGVLSGTTGKGIGSYNATSDAVNVTIKVAGLTLNIEGIHSDAKSQLVDCDLPAVQTGASRIAKVTLNGVTLLNATATYQSLNLLNIAKLYVNQTETGPGGTITKRAVFLDLAGTDNDVVLGEAIAGAACGPLPT